MIPIYVQKNAEIFFFVQNMIILIGVDKACLALVNLHKS